MQKTPKAVPGNKKNQEMEKSPQNQFRESRQVQNLVINAGSDTWTSLELPDMKRMKHYETASAPRRLHSS